MVALVSTRGCLLTNTVTPPQIPFKLHVIVGPTDTDSIAKVVAAKAEDLGASLVVVARHSKGKLKVR